MSPEPDIDFARLIREAIDAPTLEVTIPSDHPLYLDKHREAAKTTEGTFIKPHGSRANPCMQDVAPSSVRYVPLNGRFSTMPGEDGKVALVELLEITNGVIAADCPNCNQTFTFSLGDREWYPLV